MFTKVSNKLLHSGKFPEEWSVGISVALVKVMMTQVKIITGGATLLRISGKFFLGVLLERLNDVISQFEILEKTR